MVNIDISTLDPAGKVGKGVRNTIKSFVWIWAVREKLVIVRSVEPVLVT